MKKVNISKVSKYSFIIYCIFLIGNVMFITPETDNVLGLGLLTTEICAAMSIEQLGLLVGLSLIVGTLTILNIATFEKEKILSKKIIVNLIKIIFIILIVCIGSIYMYHKFTLCKLVTNQTQICIDELKDDLINPSQININKIKTSANWSRKYRYIAIDYSYKNDRKVLYIS